MKIIGVTGGIGSGKSTVSGILANMGAEVIDADLIARKVVAKGEKALEELTVYFGNEILDQNGELDRKKLSTQVFNNPNNLKLLNSITHKYISEEIIHKVQKIKNEGMTQIIVLDVPIPLEYGFLNIVDTVWVVYADKETRIKRIMNRSGFTREEALHRINSQKSDEEYEEIATEILCNNGDVEELKKDVVKLLNKI